MSLCSFSEDYLMQGATPIENIFILNYMPHANGDFVKVYLYGLMQCYSHADISIERLAQLLDMDVEVVQNAFQFWERQGLLQRISDNPVSYRFLSVLSASATESPMEQEIYRHRDFNNRLQLIFDTRLLHPNEFSEAAEWIEDMGLPEEVVLIMVESYVKRHGKSSRFKSIAKQAAQWAQDGILTIDQAKQAAIKDSAAYLIAQKVLKQFNLRRQPTVDEVNLAVKWTDEWKLAEADIIAACAETVKGRNPSFAYLDGILKGGNKEQLSEKNTVHEAIKALHKALGITQVSPTPAECDNYRNFLIAGYTPEALQFVAEAMGALGKRYTMDDFQHQIESLCERGLTSVEDIKANNEHQKAVKKQLAKLNDLFDGSKAIPQSLLEEWLGGASYELITCAAQIARGTQTPARYIAGLLRNWQAEGITTPEEARSRLPKPAAAADKQPQALQYLHHEYTAEELDAILDARSGYN